jgi:Tol biopolymer transport system component
MAKRQGRRLVLGVGAVLCAGALSGCAQQYRSQLVSINAAGTNSGSAESGNFTFSPDGTKIVFDSTSVDLVSPATPSGATHVYLRDLTTGKTRLVSVNAAGTGPANRRAMRPVLSPDGTKVAFVSSATNMGPPSDGDNVDDVFVRDLTSNTTSLVSVNASGTDGGSSASAAPVWSPDSTKVAFRSGAADLGPTDTNGQDDVYVRDLVAHTTALVSINHLGTAAGAADPDTDSERAAFSPDGTKIAFQSWATDLVPNDANGRVDVFVRDLTTSTTRLVSTDSTGTVGANGFSVGPVFSPDSTRVAFESQASNLGPTDANGVTDIYVKDLTTGATSLATINVTGAAAGAGPARLPVFVPGRAQLAFSSEAPDLVANDTNGSQEDIFIRDLATGTTQLVTTGQAGASGTSGMSTVPVFNADGTRMAFVSAASNFGPKDTNNTFDVYVKDLPGGITSLVSFNAAGDNAANGQSSVPQFQPHGTKIAFVSWASNLVALDHDLDQDVFLASVVASG